MAEDNFSSARFESIRKTKYQVKQKKNTTSYNLVAEYLKSSGKLTRELQEATYRYKMAQRSVITLLSIPDSFPGITQDVIESAYNEVKENALEKFQKFFVSYKNRLQENSEDREERIANALNDLKIAYSTYRKVNIKGWNTPREQITISEMENLYNLMNPTNNDNKTEKNVEK